VVCLEDVVDVPPGGEKLAGLLPFLAPPQTYQLPFISHAQRRNTGLPYLTSRSACLPISASCEPLRIEEYVVPRHDSSAYSSGPSAGIDVGS
jgi:hypothetical protein